MKGVGLPGVGPEGMYENVSKNFGGQIHRLVGSTVPRETRTVVFLPQLTLHRKQYRKNILKSQLRERSPGLSGEISKLNKGIAPFLLLVLKGYI